MAHLPEITEETLDAEVLKSELPVLVDFGAEWCMPCKRLLPVVEQLASDLEGRLKVVKIDIDKAQSVAIRYGVMSVPTLLLIKDGEVKEQIMGLQSRPQLEARITPHLAR